MLASAILFILLSPASCHRQDRSTSGLLNAEIQETWDWENFQQAFPAGDFVGDKLRGIMATFEIIHREVTGGEAVPMQDLVQPGRNSGALVQLRIAYDEVVLTSSGGLVTVESTMPAGVPTGKSSLTQIALKVDARFKKQRKIILQDQRFQAASQGFNCKEAGSTTIEMDVSGYDIDKTAAVKAVAQNPGSFRHGASRVAILDVDGTTMAKNAHKTNNVANHLGQSKAKAAIHEIISKGGLVVLNSGNMAMLQIQRLLPAFTNSPELLHGLFLIAQGGTVGYRFDFKHNKFIAKRMEEWNVLVEQAVHGTDRFRTLPFVADDEWEGNRATSRVQLQVYVGDPKKAAEGLPGPIIVTDTFRGDLPALVMASGTEESGDLYQDEGLAVALAGFASVPESYLANPTEEVLGDRLQKVLSLIVDPSGIATN